ncbi:MAG: NADPH:quinone oxidoreductase family protein [Actinomycetota bacterium]
MSRAWQVNELGLPWDVLQVAEVSVPEPGEGAVVIAVEATDLNFADILQCQGQYQVKLEPPFTPGMSTGGTIVSVGAGVDLVAGQRVIGMTIGSSGGYAEHAVLATSNITVVPDDVPSLTAVGGHVPYSTTWFALHRRGQLKPEDTVLVLAAAGGVGASAVQMAKVHGCRVIAAAGGEAKVQVARDLGADVAIDYSAEDLYARVKEETEGRGVDVVYDPVGGDYFDIARRLVAWEGRYLVVGFAAGSIPTLPANHLLVKNYSMVGVYMGGYHDFDPERIEECNRVIYPMMADGRLTPLVSRTVGFDDLPDALLDLYERRSIGRILFDPRA